MRGQITIGSKIGYLNPKNGKYMYSEVIHINTETFTLQQRDKWKYQFEEKIEDLIKWAKEQSPDFKRPMPLVKIVCNTKLY